MVHVRKNFRRSNATLKRRRPASKRRSVRSRFSRKRSGRQRGVSTSVTAMLTDALTMPDYYEDTNAVVCTIPATTGGYMPCSYFTARADFFSTVPGTNYGDPWSHNDPLVAKTIADHIVTNSGATNAFPLKFSIKNFEQCHTISSGSNVPVQVEGYLCSWRRDIPVSAGMQFVLDILGAGFTSNSMGTGAGHTSTALFHDEYDPFASSDFVVRAKIHKVVSRIIQPGQDTKFFLKHSIPFMVRPYLNCNILGGTVPYASANLSVDYSRGGKFWLFKLRAPVTDANTAAGQITVAGSTRVIRCVTLSRWTYKYVVQDKSDSFFSSQGVSAPLTPFSMNPLTAVSTPPAGII